MNIPSIIKLTLNKNYNSKKAAINISQNPVHHERMKHVKVNQHFILEKIEEGVSGMSYVPTTKQATDTLAKGQPRPLFEKLLDKLEMFNWYGPASEK